MHQYQEKNRLISTFSIFFLIPLSGLVTDIYLPSFPAMQTALHTTPGGIQSTLSCFLISYGLSLLLAGSIVDAVGRYRVVLISLIAFLVTNIAIAMTPSLPFICMMRIVQGIASAFVVVGKRAFLVDIYKGEKLKNYTGLLTIIWAMAPISAPFIGGYLEKAFGWTANFWFLAGYSFMALIIEWFFVGEAMTVSKSLKKTNILRSYKEVLSAPDFSLGIVILGCGYGMVMVFGMTAPFIIEHTLGLTSITTGYCALLSGTGLLLGGIIGKTLHRTSFFRKMFLAMLLLFLFIAGMFTTSGAGSLLVLMLFVIFLHTVEGFIYNVQFTYNLTRFPQHAGTASGLTSGGCYLVTSIVSTVITKTYSINGQKELSYSYFSLGIALLLVLIFLKNKKIRTLELA